MGAHFFQYASSIVTPSESIASSEGNPDICDRIFLEMSRYMKTQSVYGNSGVFNQVNNMFAEDKTRGLYCIEVAMWRHMMEEKPEGGLTMTSVMAGDM